MDKDLLLRNNPEYETHMEQLLSKIKNYNIYDILMKTSALNLLPYNQNKSIIFDSLIDTIIRSDFLSYTSENKISMKKFKEILNIVMESNIAFDIDPSEMPFIQRIEFYGNFWIFSGINTNIGYNLQSLINVLFLRKNDFPNAFIFRCKRMIHLILSTTNRIVDKLSYNIDTLGHYEKSEIDYPNSSKLNELSELLKVNIAGITELLAEESESIFYTNSVVLDEKFQSIHNCKFFYSPFLKINDSQALILNPTILPVYAIYYILKLAKQYFIFDELISLYNNEIWQDCRKFLKKLGHKRIDASKEGVALINSNYYKEDLVTVDNKNLLFIRFFCDNGKNYDSENFFGYFKLNTNNLEDRWNYLSEKINKCNEENFYELIISNSYGRAITFSFQKEQCKKSISLSPFELYCISVNERNHKNFIARYIESKNKSANLQLLSYGDFVYVTVYTENHYSFYFDDDIDMRSTFLFPPIGDSVDYINRALQKEDKQLACLPNSSYMKEIVLQDKVRNIYCSSFSKSIGLMVRFSNVDIWINSSTISSIEILNVYYSVIDLISYWLGELKKLIETLSFQFSVVAINIYLEGDINEYFYQKNIDDGGLSRYIRFDKYENILNVYFTPSAFLNLDSKDNNSEKELMYLILKELTVFTAESKASVLFENKFLNISKKKIFSLDFQSHPYFKPIDTHTRIIPVEYENYLLNDLGDFFLKKKGMKYGLVDEDYMPSFCQEAVSYLYDMLKEKVSKLNGYQLCKYIYLDLEKVMYSMMLSQKRYAFDVACYPEERKNTFDKINEMNRNSLAMKFLLEYVIATQPDNDVIVGEMDYENLLTICSFIIEWANNRDLFQYKIINSKVRLLQSGRIGIDKAQISHFTNSNYQSYTNRLNAHSSPLLDTYSPGGFLNKFQKEIDNAFKDEYGYTFSNFSNCIEAIIAIGDDLNPEVKIMQVEKTTEKIQEMTDLTREIIKKIIDDLSLKKRPNYLIPPKGYSKKDIWPWIFNRRLSFTRRPLLIYGDDMIWGNRQLYHCLRFTLDLIIEGKFQASKNKLKSLIGQIANQRGNDFNDVVADRLRTFDFLTVYSKVKKINGKKIVLSDNNTLGDIDVLIINHKSKHIIVAETKDFSFTKTPHEMYREYCNVFCDNENKLCYLSKHKKRVQWISNHINDVIAQYNLGNEKWKVKDIFITNEIMVSNEFFHIKQSILLYSEICKKKLISL